MTQWHLAIREIRRNGLRSVLIALSIFVAASVTTAVVLLIIGVNRGITHTAGRLGADLMVIPEGENVAREFNEALITGRKATFYFESSVVETISQVPGVLDVTAQTFAETLTNARCCAGEFFIVGFDPESDFTIRPWLSDDVLKSASTEENWAIVGDRILLHTGDTIEFYGTRFTVAGVLEPTSMGMDWTVYIPDSALRKMVSGSRAKAEAPLRITEGAFSALFVKAVPDVDIIDLAEKIESRCSSGKVQVVLASSVARLARGQMTTLTGILICVAAALWIMALVLSGSIFAQAVRERQSELGLLIAKGADRTFVFGLIAKEAIAIAIGSNSAGFLISLAVAASFSEPLAGILGVPEALPAYGITFILAAAFICLSTASSVIAALLPAWPILKAEPIEAIKRGKTI